MMMMIVMMMSIEYDSWYSQGEKIQTNQLHLQNHLLMYEKKKIGIKFLLRNYIDQLELSYKLIIINW